MPAPTAAIELRVIFRRALGAVLPRRLALRLRREWLARCVVRGRATRACLRDNFIAFRKAGDDVLGDGSGESRKWDQHVDF